MKTIKVITLIDLLNKIAKGEEVPKSFKIAGVEYYINDSGFLQECNGEEVQWFIYRSWLNEKVEIIEEEKKDNFTGWKMYQDGKEICSMDCSAEEEKKLPEKLEYYDDSIAWVIDDVGQLSNVDKVIIDKLNDVIDYFKSKGE